MDMGKGGARTTETKADVDRKPMYMGKGGARSQETKADVDRKRKVNAAFWGLHQDKAPYAVNKYKPSATMLKAEVLARDGSQKPTYWSVPKLEGWLKERRPPTRRRPPRSASAAVAF